MKRLFENDLRCCEHESKSEIDQKMQDENDDFDFDADDDDVLMAM